MASYLKAWPLHSVTPKIDHHQHSSFCLEHKRVGTLCVTAKAHCNGPVLSGEQHCPPQTQQRLNTERYIVPFFFKRGERFKLRQYGSLKEQLFALDVSNHPGRSWSCVNTGHNRRTEFWPDLNDCFYHKYLRIFRI